MKKIKNVPLSVCCCEQKIAYNLAFKEHINNDAVINTLKRIDAEQNAIINSIGYVAALNDKQYQNLCDEKIATIDRLTADCFNMFRHNPDYDTICKRYYLPDIKAAFAHGIGDYLVKPFIASDYKQIGQCFWV